MKSGAQGPVASYASVRHQCKIHLLNVFTAELLLYNGRCLVIFTLLKLLYMDVKHGREQRELHLEATPKIPRRPYYVQEEADLNQDPTRHPHLQLQVDSQHE